MGLASGVATFVAVRAKSNYQRSKTHARINLSGADRTSGHAAPRRPYVTALTINRTRIRFVRRPAPCQTRIASACTIRRGGTIARGDTATDGTPAYHKRISQSLARPRRSLGSYSGVSHQQIQRTWRA